VFPILISVLDANVSVVTEPTLRNVFVAGVAILFVWVIFAVAQVQDNQEKIENAVARAKELGLKEGREFVESGKYAVYTFSTANDAGEEIIEPFGGDLGVDIGCLGSQVDFRFFYAPPNDTMLDNFDDSPQFDDLNWVEIDEQRLIGQLRTSSHYAESFNSAMRGVLPVSRRPGCVRE
jgi:hypothetical protein